MTPQKLYLLLAPLMLVNACDPAAHGSNRAADATQRAFHDTTEKWKGLFSYNPQKVPPQAPQSRYCYSIQADIVCYDSPQPNMTAKLSGYQDGANISSFQPGGGSLGVSGGEPTAMYRTEEVQTSLPQLQSAPGVDMVDTDPVITAVPFESGESSYARNAAIADQMNAQKTTVPVAAVPPAGAAVQVPAQNNGPIVINDVPAN